MVYVDLFKKMDEKQVRYLLCGGLAVSIYGIPRSTADIDLLLDFDESNLLNFCNVMKELNYQSSVPVDLIKLNSSEYRNKLMEDKNLTALSFLNHLSNIVHIDVLINIPFRFEDLWKRKVVREFNDLKIQLISVEDLIEMKKPSNRIQDQQDIIQLTKLSRR